MAVAVSVMTEGYPLVPIRLPSSGLAKAHGLYQFAFVRVLAAHVTFGLDGSGEPPAPNGSRTGIARAEPFAGVLLFGETVNGVPVCAAKVRLDDQPPTVSSTRRESWRNALPLPKGNS